MSQSVSQSVKQLWTYSVVRQLGSQSISQLVRKSASIQPISLLVNQLNELKGPL